MEYRWIIKQCTKAKGKEYHFYSVKIKDRYRFSSKNLDNCIQFLLHFAEQNNIPKHELIKKNSKHLKFQEL